MNFAQKIILIIAVFISVFSFRMNISHAQFVPVNVQQETAMTAIQRTTDTQMLQIKNYVLDGLAYAVAKIVLQQITASVVNWINTGFEGNPSFVTNPEGFMVDTADQITGAFISNTGALSRLCSPFNIDIRLSLALNYGYSGYQERYACTLSTVINNVKNSKVNVSGNASLNGPNSSVTLGGGVGANGSGQASVGGFMAGDFSQGGWPAYIAMTTQPQNNIYGAYLLARDDLATQIANRQNNIKFDLSVSQGFQSFKTCKTITEEEAAAYQGADIQMKEGKDGNYVYKKCEVQTPGSVIAGAINKSLGIPQDTLNLANSLNQIVGALFSQLVTKVLQSGLHSASKGGSTASAGIASQLLTQPKSQQIGPMKAQLKKSLTNNYAKPVAKYINTYEDIMSRLSTYDSYYTDAASCFTKKAAKSLAPNQMLYVQNELSAIASATSTGLAPLVATYQAKLNDAYNKNKEVQDLANNVDSATSIEALQAISNSLTDSVQTGTAVTTDNVNSPVSASDLSAAQDDLNSVKSAQSKFKDEAGKFSKACKAFPDSVPAAGSGY